MIKFCCDAFMPRWRLQNSNERWMNDGNYSVNFPHHSFFHRWLIWNYYYCQSNNTLGTLKSLPLDVSSWIFEEFNEFFSFLITNEIDKQNFFVWKIIFPSTTGNNAWWTQFWVGKVVENPRYQGSKWKKLLHLIFLEYSFNFPFLFKRKLCNDFPFSK